jgi:hypothetical protein
MTCYLRLHRTEILAIATRGSIPGRLAVRFNECIVDAVDQYVRQCFYGTPKHSRRG